MKLVWGRGECTENAERVERLCHMLEKSYQRRYRGIRFSHRAFDLPYGEIIRLK